MEGLWKRETGHILNRKRENYPCYNLRRIVTASGRKLPAYDYFVHRVKAQAEKAKAWYPNVLLYPAARKAEPAPKAE